MADIDAKLIVEMLRSIQGMQSEIKATLADHTRQLLRIREEINGLRTDDLGRESMQAQMDVRLDRIAVRLQIHDA